MVSEITITGSDIFDMSSVEYTTRLDPGNMNTCLWGTGSIVKTSPFAYWLYQFLNLYSIQYYMYANDIYDMYVNINRCYQ